MGLRKTVTGLTSWDWPLILAWKATSRLAIEKLLPDVLWAELLKYTRRDADIAALFSFDIVLNARAGSA
ncbi:MAG: hypothetical protein AAF703_14860 [Cyanobacteria bacterium P01_D01_bin.105]